MSDPENEEAKQKALKKAWAAIVVARANLIIRRAAVYERRHNNDD